MTPYYADETCTLWLGDCREVMAGLAANSIDAVVCDPPYELVSGNAVYDLPMTGSGNPRVRRASGGGFMGKKWDSTGVAFDPNTWAAALRVAKPGAYLVAFGAPRTYHRLACAIEDAGWEMRDSLIYMFGSGFPKSLNLDRDPRFCQCSAVPLADERGPQAGRSGALCGRCGKQIIPRGLGTALKPAYEPIVVARKPLAGTVAANVAAWGTGVLNIDACRIGTNAGWSYPNGRGGEGWHGRESLSSNLDEPMAATAGRWPANVAMDEAAAALLDEKDQRQTGTLQVAYGDSGGPSRFFYTSKASRAEREAGIEGAAVRRSDGREKDIDNPRLRTNARKNHHPTVKPLDLMRWLVRLVTPPDGLVLDPFLGSGTTRIAAQMEGRRFAGIEIEPEYMAIALARLTQTGMGI